MLDAFDNLPLSGIVEPSDIEDTAVFLASDQAREISGQTVHVNASAIPGDLLAHADSIHFNLINASNLEFWVVFLPVRLACIVRLSARGCIPLPGYFA